MSRKLPLGELRYQRARVNSINALVPFYLMSSYLYYHKDESLLLDETFDKLCKELLDNWDKITHPHRDFIRKEDLPAGTCALRLGSFPSIVKAAACDMLKLDYVWKDPGNDEP